MDSFWETAWLWLRTHGLRVVLIVVVAYGLLGVLRRLTRRLQPLFALREADPIRAREQEQRGRTLRRVLDSVLWVAIVIIAGAMVLNELGVEVGPLLAGAGVVGIALSLGAQSLVKDVLAGFFILFEDQFRIGDSIAVAGVSGVVEQMNLRSTGLRDLEGTVHVVPNGEMRVVSNRTRDWARVVLRIGVAYGTDLDRAMDVLRQLGKELAADPEWRERVLEEPAVLGVDDLRDSDIALLLLIRTAPGEQWAVGREARQRIVETLTREGIDMPYPTQVNLTRQI